MLLFAKYFTNEQIKMTYAVIEIEGVKFIKGYISALDLLEIVKAETIKQGDSMKFANDLSDEFNAFVAFGSEASIKSLREKLDK